MSISFKYIYVDVSSKPKRIIVEENGKFILYTELDINGPSKLVCGKRTGFKGGETSVWIETSAEIIGILSDIQPE